MNIWDVLGIEETKNKDLLKTAYRNKLTKVNPEDDPEGFMELRNAYEEAVKMADKVETDENKVDENTPMGKLLLDIKSLYEDYDRRIDVNEWKDLFNSDYFVSLESSEDAFNTLMRFLMENFYLPKKIWKLLCETFDIDSRKKEYAERFPEDFLNYILNNSTYDDIINYYLFDGDVSLADKYIEKYYLLDIAIRKHEIGKQEQLIDELDNMDIEHPYLEICKIRNSIQKYVDHDFELTKDESGERFARIAKEHENELICFQNQMEELCETFPDDVFVLTSCGDVAMTRQDYEKARTFFEMAADVSPENYMVKAKLADVAYFDGDYLKSRDLYLDLLKINHYDNNVRAGMLRANYGLIEKHKEHLVDNPEDNDTRMEMAWSYYQSYRFKEAIDILNEFDPTDEKKCEYYNVKGRSYLCLFDYENAKSCFMIWVDEIKKISEEDNSEEAIKKKKRYEYANFLIADCYLKTDNYDEARKYLNIALAKEHEEIIISLEALCELEYETDNYEACIEACDRLIQRDQRNYIAYSFMAKACFKLDYIKEVMSSCERAISIYPYISEPYVLEIKVFLRYNQLEQARQVVKRYKEFSVPSDNVDLFEAIISAREEKYEKAITTLTILIDKLNKEDTDLDDIDEPLMELAYCYEKTGRLKEAKKCYEEIIQSNPNHTNAHGRIAFIYKNECNYDNALNEFSKQIELNPNAYYFINRGLLNRFMGKFNDALNDYYAALETEPYNCFCLNRIALLHEEVGEFEKAVSFYDRTIACAGENDKEIKKKTYEGKARILQCMNRFEESRKTYELLFEEFGMYADMVYDYSELLLRMNKMDEAVEALQKCIKEQEYSKDIQMCLRQLCFIYGQEGYLDKAYESFEVAISKDKEDAKAYAIMGEVFLNAKRYDEAKKMYEQAVSFDKGNKENYYSRLVEAIILKRSFWKPDLKNYIIKADIKDENLRYPIKCVKMARLSRLTKKYQKALELIDKSLRMKRCRMCFYGRCHEAIYEKGLIYEAMKDYEKARVCYKEAIAICGHNLVYEEKLKRIEGK